MEGGVGVMSTFVKRVKDLVNYVCVTVTPRVMEGEELVNEVSGANLVGWRWGDGDGRYRMLEFDTDQMVWARAVWDFVLSCSFQFTNYLLTTKSIY